MRRTLAGPGSSTGNYNPTLDPGKQMANNPSGGSGYRRTGEASGPASSHDNYTATLDPGKALPASANDGGKITNRSL
jgi:hypothetical protein